MVKGLEKFRDFFKGFESNYIIIGGTACDLQFSEIGLDFRATKDIDLILVVEALSDEFIGKFWAFVKDGNYINKQKSTGDRKFYRFIQPENSEYPFQLELFSRKPDFLDDKYDSNLAPIPTGEDLSSLSAILMNDDFYSFTINTAEVKDGLCIASVETLICLKAKAYLELKNRKIAGKEVSSKQIKKHLLDVLRLTQLLTSEKPESVPDTIKNDINLFLIDILGDNNLNSSLISLKIRISLEEITEQLRNIFNLD